MDCRLHDSKMDQLMSWRLIDRDRKIRSHCRKGTPEGILQLSQPMNSMLMFQIVVSLWQRILVGWLCSVDSLAGKVAIPSVH